MRNLLTFGPRLFIVWSVGLAAILGVGGVMLYEVHDLDPQAWNQSVYRVLGNSVSPGYVLSPEEEKAATAQGLDPNLVARASAVEMWAESQWGKGSGDRAIYIALTRGESGNCVNCGVVDAGRSLASHPALNGAAQKRDLNELLEVWQRADIRSTNPIAAEYIYDDYSGVLGSVGAGALGCSQFLPSTAIQHLKAVGEPFDLWQPYTAMEVMAAELHRLGWRKDLTVVRKAEILLGWNQAPNWVAGIVSAAETYGQYLGVRSGLEDVFGNTTGIVAMALDWLGLLPEMGVYSGVQSAALILPGEWQLPIHAATILTSDVADHARRGQSDVAWDFWGYPGTMVYPARAGKVDVASYGNDGTGYGHWVRIDHGDGTKTIYAHLGTLQVKVGQLVTTSSPLGEIAQTGRTSWPHSHFEVYQKGVAVDPEKVFGKPQDVGLPYTFWTKLPAKMRSWEVPSKESQGETTKTGGG